MGACAATHGHPPRCGAPRAGTRAPVAPGGQAGPFGSPRHGLAPGGPCARRFGVGRSPQGQKGQNWPKTRFFEVSGRKKSHVLAFGGFLNTLRGPLGDGEARGTKKILLKKRIFLGARASGTPGGASVCQCVSASVREGVLNGAVRIAIHRFEGTLTGFCMSRHGSVQSKPQKIKCVPNFDPISVRSLGLSLRRS